MNRFYFGYFKYIVWIIIFYNTNKIFYYNCRSEKYFIIAQVNRMLSRNLYKVKISIESKWNYFNPEDQTGNVLLIWKKLHIFGLIWTLNYYKIFIWGRRSLLRTQERKMQSFSLIDSQSVALSFILLSPNTLLADFGWKCRDKLSESDWDLSDIFLQNGERCVVALQCKAFSFSTYVVMSHAWKGWSL